MELWIRSQDEEDLLEAHNLGLAYKGKYGFMDKIGDIDGYCICEFINDYHVKLGTYATKERALEILDEIQKLLIPTYKFIANKDLAGNDIKVYGVEYINSYVYEMPEE